MADDPTVSTTVPETVTTTLGVDKASADSVNAAFEDFWRDEDKGDTKEPSEAPEAPGEGAAQETRHDALDPSPEPKPTPTPSAHPSKEEITDEEIDKVELPPHSRPELVDQVRHLKEGWKADRARAKSEAERAAKLQADLEEARRNALTPELKADYEHAVSVRRKFEFASDPDFIQRFHQPVQDQFLSVLQEAVGMLPDRQEAEKWAAGIAANWSPDKLNKEWWSRSVVDKVPEDIDRETLRSSIAQLVKLQKDRDMEVYRRTQDKSAYDNWVQEKNQLNQKRLEDEIRLETGIQEKRLQEHFPRDVSQAKTAEERRAIEEHNERFEKLNKYYQDCVKDCLANGARGWVRASVAATQGQYWESQYNTLEKDLKSTKAERDQLKTELDKIAGARRKISSTTGTPPSTGKKTTSDGLSIKNLDVRKALDDYFGDEGSR
jgi:hypothetical protein